MASVPAGAVPPVNGLPAKTEDGEAKATNGETAAVNWESEVQLVSSLAKLQELERRVSDVKHNNYFPGKCFSSGTHTSNANVSRFTSSVSVYQPASSSP